MHEVHIPPNSLTSCSGFCCSPVVPEGLEAEAVCLMSIWWALEECFSDPVQSALLRWWCRTSSRSPSLALHHSRSLLLPLCILLINNWVLRFCLCALGKTIKRGSRSCSDEGNDAERERKKQAVLVLRLRAVRSCLISPIEMLEWLYVCVFRIFF